MSTFRKRLMAATGDTDARFLRYWWDAHDPLAGGSWVDRINGVRWQMHGTTEHDTAAGTLRFPVGSWAQCHDMMDFGRHFRMVYDVRGIIPADNARTHNLIFADYNSIKGSDKGFYCGLGKSPTGTGYASMNYKMFGNYGGTGSFNFGDGSYPQEFDSVEDGIFEFGNTVYDENNDILWFRAHHGRKGYGIDPHPIIRHDSFGSRFGMRLMLNTGAIGTQYGNSIYNHDMTYRSIKIYVYD